MEIQICQGSVTINVTIWWVMRSEQLAGVRNPIEALLPPSQEETQDSAPRPGLDPPIRHYACALPASPLLPADTRRACALLPHVGSGRQRARLNSCTEIPS